MTDQCLQLLGCVSYACLLFPFPFFVSFFFSFFISSISDPEQKSSKVTNPRTCNVHLGLISEPGTDAHSTYSSAIDPPNDTGVPPELWFCSAAPFPIICYLHPLSADLTCSSGSLAHCWPEAGVRVCCGRPPPEQKRRYGRRGGWEHEIRTTHRHHIVPLMGCLVSPTYRELKQRTRKEEPEEEELWFPQGGWDRASLSVNLHHRRSQRVFVSARTLNITLSYPALSDLPNCPDCSARLSSPQPIPLSPNIAHTALQTRPPFGAPRRVPPPRIDQFD